jgi:hypothetical protein
VAHAQILEAKRKKLDDRGEKYIFIGYSETSKAYKVYNPITNKVMVSRDVIFNKNEAWTWSKNEANENVLVEESEEGQQQQEQPNTPTFEASSSNDSENLSSRRIRTLEDIHMRTQQIDGDETNLFFVSIWILNPLTLMMLCRMIIGGLSWRKRFEQLRKIAHGS